MMHQSPLVAVYPVTDIHFKLDSIMIETNIKNSLEFARRQHWCDIDCVSSFQFADWNARKFVYLFIKVENRSWLVLPNRSFSIFSTWVQFRRPTTAHLIQTKRIFASTQEWRHYNRRYRSATTDKSGMCQSACDSKIKSWTAFHIFGLDAWLWRESYELDWSSKCVHCATKSL